MRKRFWVMAVLAVSCAPALPSTVPLGRGPLAASTVEEPEAPPPASSSSAVDAAPEASSDAGAADASDDASVEAKDSEAPATDGGAEDAAPEAAAPTKPAVVYAGHYAGEDVTKFTGGPMAVPPQKDPNATLDVADQGGGTLEFSLIESRSGKVVCKLEGTASGNTARITPGQHCFDQQSQGMMTATVGSGTATFDSGKLVFDLHMDLEVHAGGRTASGSIDYHFEGTRQ